MSIYGILKNDTYFKLKSPTTLLLVPIAIYRFTCLCDTGNTYTGRSSRQGFERVSRNPKLGRLKIVSSCLLV